MLSKTKHPHLNRAARRHPKKHLAKLQQAMGAATVLSSWLLAGLFIKAGITQAINHEGAQV